MKFSTLPYFVKLLLYSLLFAGITKLGLSFSFVDTSFAQIWSPTGLSLAVLFFAGIEFLPAIFLGVAVNYIPLVSSIPLGTALALGTVLEASVGIALLKRWNFNPELRTLRDVGLLVVISGGLSTFVNALFGITSVGIAQPEIFDRYVMYVLLWWMGNLVGVIVIAPLLFVLVTRKKGTMEKARAAEFLVLLSCTFIVSQFVFHGKFFNEQLNYSLAFVLFPFTIWSTIRFGIVGSITTTYIISLNATLSTQTGLGLFATESYLTSIILVDIFLIVLGSTSLALASLTEERTTAEQTIRKSEESYRIITERTGQLTYDYDVATGYIKWNGAITDVTQYSPEEFSVVDIARWAEYIHPEDRERAEGHLTEAMRLHQEYNIEYRFRRKDGSYLDVFDRGAFLYHHETDETAYRMLGTMADISHVNLTLSKLKKSEERYRMFSFLASDYVYSARLEGREYISEWASPAFERLTGYTLDEVNALGWKKIIHDDDYERTVQGAERLYKGESVIMEYRIRNKNGAIVWIRDYMQPLLDTETKQLVRITGGVQDITERKRAEEHIKNSEERFRMLIEKSADAIVLLDRNGMITFASNAVTPIIGYSPEELIGKNVFFYAHPEDAKRLIMNLGKILFLPEKTGATITRFRHKEGSWIFIEGSVTNMLYNPNVRSLVANFRNVTHRINADDRLRRSLLEKEILLKEVHHRVKNNMQVISSLLNLQSNSLTDKASIGMFRESQNRVKSMALVHEILYQSRDITSVNFSRYVRQLIGMLQQSFGAKASPVAVSVNVGNIVLDIDAAIPCGLIVNELVSNSFKHAFSKKQNPEIEVSMKKKGTLIQLTVRDNGIGIPKSKTTASATLGLKLVRALTEQIKGTLVISSKRGTSFIIEFPAHKNSGL